MSNQEKLKALFEQFEGYAYRNDLKVLCTPDFYFEWREAVETEFEQQVSKSNYSFDQVPTPLSPYGIPVVTTAYLPSDCNPCAIDHKRQVIFKLADTET